MASIAAPMQSDVDDEIRLNISYLKPRQKVAIVAQTTRNAVTLSSFANYESNDIGEVDLRNQSALPGGNYEGVEPMGLFWSMELTSEVQIPFKMLNGNDLDKWSYDIKVLDGHYQSLDEAVKSTANPLAKTTIDRMFVPKGVRRFNVYYGKLRGTLFLPEGENQKFPAIIDIFGGANGLVAYRGGLFAKHGFACLCVAYAAYADLPRELAKIEFEYFNDGYEFLSRHPNVDKDNIGAFGSCLGGTIALMTARCQPKLKAVAAVSPEAVCGGWDYVLKEDGKKLVVPGVQWKQELTVFNEQIGALDIKPCVLQSVNSTENGYRRHILEYGKIKAPLLLMYGSDDQFFLLDFVLPVLREQLEKENKKNAEIVVYPGAGHIIQPCHLPLFGKYHSPAFNIQMWFGGQKVPHARAQENMWARTLDFFNKHLSNSNAASKL